MRLKEILEQKDILTALDELAYAGNKPKGKGNDPILVGAYVVHAHWRRRPVRSKKHSLKVISGGKS